MPRHNKDAIDFYFIWLGMFSKLMLFIKNLKDFLYLSSITINNFENEWKTLYSQEESEDI